MDTFKIIVIIFLMILTYQIYQLNCTVYKDTEGFESAQQSLGGVDDTNAINTLAQIAKNLMAGGVTVPGNMTVTGGLNTTNNINARTGEFNTRIGGIWTAPGIYAEGDKNLEIGAGSKNIFIGAADNSVKQNLTITGDLNFPNATTIKSGGRLHVAGEELLYILNKSGVIIGKEWGGSGNLNVQGDLVAQGRNILAELNDLRANAVRKDAKYYIDIKERANNNDCCYIGKSLIINDGICKAYETYAAAKFNFRQA